MWKPGRDGASEEGPATISELQRGQERGGGETSRDGCHVAGQRGGHRSDLPSRENLPHGRARLLKLGLWSRRSAPASEQGLAPQGSPASR